MSVVPLSGHLGYHLKAEDDLESIFWVFCYNLLRYTNLHRGSGAQAQRFLHSVFDYRNEMGKGSTMKFALLWDMELGLSGEMQPLGVNAALSKLFHRIPTPLLQHAKLREIEHIVAADSRRPPKDEDEREHLDYLEGILQAHKAKMSEEGETFGYTSFAALFVAALAVEGRRTTDVASYFRGSIRVEDRCKEKPGTDDSAGCVDPARLTQWYAGKR